jgi:nucleotide-binding universal stress UspA family protein
MMRLAEILAAIDFSSSSKSAARHAYALARRHDAALTLLHADHPPDFARGMAEHAASHHRGGLFVEEAYLRQRDEMLRAMLAELANPFEGASVRLAVPRNDDPADAIVRAAERDHTDLVVLGPHGDGNRRHAWLGSTAFDVATSVACPVLVARLTIDDELLRRPLIALPADGGFAAHLDVAVALAAPESLLTILHVVERGRARSSDSSAASALEARVGELVAGHRAVRVEVVEAPNAADAILARVARDEHDLVVVGRSEHTDGAARLGAIARRLLEKGRTSVGIVATR